MMLKAQACGAAGGLRVAPRRRAAAGRSAGRSASLAPPRAADDDNERYVDGGFAGGEVGLKNFAEDIKKAGTTPKEKFFK